MNNFVQKFKGDMAPKFKQELEKLGASFKCPPYTHFQARGEGFVATFYTSGKFLVQGANSDVVTKALFGEVSVPAAKAPVKEEEINVPYPHIGIDESGKGDFFGNLTIAGVFLDENGAKTLAKFGVCDSKKLNDKKILELEPEIKKVSKFEVITISPKKYNELYASFKNLNSLLGWGHASVLENLLKKADAKIAISDQFASEDVIKRALKERGREVQLIQMPRAEADIAVAAASILARAEFVRRIGALSSKYEMNLPKGASFAVEEAARRFCRTYGKKELVNVAKLHFKTYEKI